MVSSNELAIRGAGVAHVRGTAAAPGGPDGNGSLDMQHMVTQQPFKLMLVLAATFVEFAGLGFQTWGYQHVHHLMSDTHGVCDWTNVTGMELPTCTAGPRGTTDDVSCAGHRADDLLPFTGLWAGQTTKLSNSEFYKFVSPTNTQMPYVYDKVSYWPACPEGKIYYGADYVAPGGATDDLGVVGAMRR